MNLISRPIITIGILAMLGPGSHASSVLSITSSPGYWVNNSVTIATPGTLDLVSGVLNLDLNVSFRGSGQSPLEIPAILGTGISTSWATSDTLSAIAWLASTDSRDNPAGTLSPGSLSLSPAISSLPPTSSWLLEMDFMSEARRRELMRLVELQRQQNALVPEPGSVLIAASAGLGMLLRRRRI